MPIGAGGLVIGSGDRCDLRITDELVSRVHLELMSEAGGVRAIDRGSRNGTLLGAARVKDVLLVESTTLQIGTTPLKIALVATPLTIELSQRSRFGDAIAHSSGMRHVFSLLERASRNEVTVLLEGDSGTGKEVLAHAIHDESARRDAPFVVVDCGAISENLVESELFGHEKGAFTGATARRLGAFEQANGGTIFLDEIGELPLDMQPKRLREPRAALVRTAEHDAGEIGRVREVLHLRQVRTAHVRPRKTRAAQVGVHEVESVAEVCPAEIGVGEDRALQIRPRQVGARDARSREIAQLERRAPQRRTAEVRAGEVRRGQERAFEVALAELRAAQSRLLQVERSEPHL